ncbi:GAF and ANTAR domain-containing protein [Pseudonocardia sp. C8]|nr:GAF and ANTAR domain-containing protein [Pseudonocardia sp. C8]MBC3191950.1 GAF and ANTAR domain-containing protein [Pseudonocardia sp. C8]
MLESLSRAARELVGRHAVRDLERTLAEIVAAAVRAVPNADAGGITIAERSAITSRYPTTDSVRRLDVLQSELREGPCITAAEQPPEDGVVYAADMAADDGHQRWPQFAPRVVEHGFRSMLSTQLAFERGVPTALNLYSREPDAFDDAARTLAGLFGLQAAVLLYGARHAANLNLALESRDVIGQAKGILQERFDVDDDQAFHMLVRTSQDTNMRLAEVARWLVEHRTETRADERRRPIA